MPKQTQGPVMTIDDLAKYLKLSTSTLYKLCAEGKVSGQKVGRHWRFHRSVIDQWLGHSGERKANNQGDVMSDGYEAFRKAVEQFFPGGFSLRDEANAIVACAFRNGPIEDLHAGKSSELLENPELSRITDDEMKKIMLNACEHMEKLLRLKQEDPGEYYQKLMKISLQFCRKWERQSAQPPDQTSGTSTACADSASRPGQQSAEP